MSIKSKLTLMITLIVTAALSLNVSLYYFTARSEMEEDALQQMMTAARQIGTTLETAEKNKQHMENTISEVLRNAAIAAMHELDPRVENVTNEELAELSRKLGVDHITLWVRVPDDIIAVKSSDPAEIGLSSKTWNYWHTAFHQLFDLEEVTVPQGHKLPHFWSGPIQYSTSNIDRIDKWGYYYDGTTDYMINPYVDAKPFLELVESYGTSFLVRNLIEDNPNLLGITGFDPEFFGEPPIMKMRDGIWFYNLDVRDIVFGVYTFPDQDRDVPSVRKAAATGEVQTTLGKIGGKRIMKSFIPLKAGKPYVVGVTFDYDVIQQALNLQLLQHALISVGLIAAACIASYGIAGISIRPLQTIMKIVEEISQGRFNRKIPILKKDELGLLASRINEMAENLHTYTDQLKDTAEELRGTKEYLESFFNHTSDAIHVTDLEGRVTLVNRAFENMFGWRAEEVVNSKIPHMSEAHMQEYEDNRRRILSGETVADHETVRLTKDGKHLDMSITVSPIRDQSGRIIAIAEIARNITTRKQSEEAVRRSEKLSVVGQLAAGVAHEIRNPLTTIRGFVQLQQQTGKLSNTHLDVMISELDRINLIVSEFLVLAKPQARNYQSADLKSLLTDVLVLVDPLAVMNNVSMNLQLADHVPPLIGEPNELKQVFINLLKNSIEAMPNGGEITIELDHAADENYAVVRITDQGCGIPEESLPRLGEPFFTTKASGTGLGLMVSQKILEDHKGVMSIQSKLNEGTCVEIRFPAAAA